MNPILFDIKDSQSHSHDLSLYPQFGYSWHELILQFYDSNKLLQIISIRVLMMVSKSNVSHENTPAYAECLKAEVQFNLDIFNPMLSRA